MNCFKKALIQSGILLGFVLPTFVFAKSVTLHWAKVEDATHYEIQVYSGEKLFLSEKTQNREAKWSHAFESGVYAFKIRGVDSTETPGEWSNSETVVVPLSAPTSLQNLPAKVVLEPSKKIGVELKWAPLSGARKYLVQIMYEGKGVLNKTTTAPSFHYMPKNKGNYTWSVAGVLKWEGEEDPKLSEKLVGKKSESESFQVEVLQLATPKLGPPEKQMETELKAKYHLKWEAVAGAEAYEVRFQPANEENRSPASTPIVLKQKDNEMDFELDKNANYRWTVRALAGLSTRGEPKFQSEVATQDIAMNYDAPTSGLFSFSLSSLFASYNYQLSASTGSASGTAIASGGAIDIQYVSHSTSNASTATNELNVLSGVGPAASIGLLHPFTKNVSASLVGSFFYPVGFTGSAGDRTMKSGNATNASAGIFGKYAISNQFDFSLGAFYRNEGLRYSSPSFGDEQIKTSYLIFSAGIGYAFGK